jgi:PKD repeat protein
VEICQEDYMLNANKPTVGTGLWTLEYGSGFIADRSSHNTTVEGLGSGLNTFTWRITDNGCSTVDTLIITNNSFVNNAGLDQVICRDSTTLSGQNPAADNGTGIWTLGSGSASIVNPTLFKTAVINLGTGRNEFVWTVTKKGCSSTAKVNITNNAVNAEAGTDQVLCVDNTNLVGNDPGSFSGLWTVASGSARIENITQFNTRVFDLGAGPNTLRWSIQGIGACSDSSDVIITNNSVIVHAGLDREICVDTVVLAGKDPEHGTGLWTALTADPGTIVSPTLYNSLVSDLGKGKNTFRWTITYKGCSDFADVDITNNSIIANAGSDQSVCYPTATLTGNDPLLGKGRWTVPSGTGTFTNATFFNTIVNSLSLGANSFRWTVTENDCVASDEVTVTNNYINISAGVDKTICGTSTTLAGNHPATGIGNWEVIGGAAAFVNSTLYNTTVSNLAMGANTFKWSIARNGCSNSDTVIITNDKPIPDAGSNQYLCDDNTILEANQPAVGVTGLWTNPSGSAFIQTPTQYYTNVTALGAGTNTFRWTLTFNGCPAFDDVQIINNTVTVTIGADQDICTDSAFLSASEPNIDQTGLWTIESGSGVIVNPSRYNTRIRELGNGANLLKWTVTNINSGCTASEEVRITNGLPTEALTGGDQTICENNTIITANAPINGTGSWVQMSGAGDIVSSTEFNTVVKNLGSGMNTFRWTISNFTCSSFDEMIVTNNTVAVDVGPNQSVCGTQAHLTANTPPVGGVGVWSVTGGTGIFANSTSPNTDVTNLGPGANNFAWTVINQGCSSSKAVTIINELPTTASTGPDQDICEDYATLVGNAPLRGTGLWTIEAGVATISDETKFNTYVYDLGAGAITFKWTITEGVCTSSDLVIINNNSVKASAGLNLAVCDSVYDLAGSDPLTGVGTWSVTGGSGIFDDVHNNTTTVRKLGSGPNTFQWTISNGSCSASSQVVISNNLPTKAIVSSDQIVCDNKAILSGNFPLKGDIGRWTVTGGSGTFDNPSLNSTWVRNIGRDNNTFRWTLSLGECSSYDEMMIVNKSVPAYAGINREICGDSVILNANAPIVGTGIWTKPSGGSAVIVEPTSFSTKVRNLNTGANWFRWTVIGEKWGPGVNDQCVEASDVVITNNLYVANAGADQPGLCVNYAQLNANKPIIGKGKWTVEGGSGQFDNDTLYSTTIRNLGTSGNTLRWTITEGICKSYDEIIVTNYSVYPTAGMDQIVCVDSAVLVASDVGNGVGEWSLEGGSGVVQVTSVNVTVVNNLGFGANTLRWTITENGCTAYDDVVVANNQFVTTAGGDQTVCGPEADLFAQEPGAGIGEWSVVGGSAVFDVSTLYNTRVRGLSEGLNTLRWTVKKNGCIDDDILTITNDLQVADPGVNQVRCQDFTTLAAIQPPKGAGLWSVISGSGNFDNPAKPNALVTSLSPGYNVLRWTVTANGCVSYGDMIVTNNKVNDQAGFDIEVCDGFANLAADNPQGGTGLWTIEGGYGVFANPTLHNTSISQMNSGVNTLRWTISRNGCSNSTEIRVTNNQFMAYAGPDQSRLVNNAVLEADLPPTATGGWSVVSGAGSFINKFDKNTAVSGLAVGVNNFRWTVQLGNCISEDVVKIVYEGIYCEAGLPQDICNDFAPMKANDMRQQGGIGTWSVVSGSATVVDPNSFETNVTNLLPGQNILRWTCSVNNYSSYDDVIIWNRSFTVTGENQDKPGLCENFTTIKVKESLSTDPLANSSGSWQIVEGSGTFSNRNYYITEVTGLAPGRNVFEWNASQYGCPASTYDTIIYNPPPAAKFTSDLIKGCSPLMVNFQNQTSTVAPVELTKVSYLWNFGNGLSSSEINPQHIYRVDYTKDKQIYTIEMIATSNFGCSDTANYQVEVYPELFVAFTSSPATAIQWPQSIFEFDNLSDRGYNNYLWDFDYGVLLSNDSLTVTHKFPTWGAYNVVLEATNKYGCSAKDSNTVVIEPPKPIANYEADVTKGCQPLTVQFTNTSNTFNDNATYFWDFGLNGTSTEKDPRRIFTEPGVYYPKLTVFNSTGGVHDTIVDTIYVYRMPTVEFSVEPDSIMLPDRAVHFFNHSEFGSIYEWHFGDGTVSEEVSPIHYYTAAGPNNGFYDAKLRVWTEHGCYSELMKQFVVFVANEAQYGVPTGFTPNITSASGGAYILGDNSNDVFYPLFKDHGIIKEYTLQIYNRLGEQIFESKDLFIGWDGYFKGELCPQDVYIWRMRGKYFDGRIFEDAGDVTLLK